EPVAQRGVLTGSGCGMPWILALRGLQTFWSADVAMVCVVEKSECFANEFGKSQGAVEKIVDAHHRLSRLAAGTALALRVAHCPPFLLVADRYDHASRWCAWL